LQRQADYLLLVNNDAIVEPSTISTLVNAAQAHPEAGFIGPLLMTLENPGVILTAGGILVNGWRPVQCGIGENDPGQMDTCPEIDYLAGYVLLVRREVVEKAGLLDEEFFLYYEDTEWCARARRSGFSLHLVPQAKAYHPDTRGRDDQNPLVTYYMVRNSLLFAAKNRAGLAAHASILTTWVRNWLSWSLRPRWRHKAPHRLALQFGLRDGLTGRYGQASPAVEQALLAKPD